MLADAPVSGLHGLEEGGCQRLWTCYPTRAYAAVPANGPAANESQPPPFLAATARRRTGAPIAEKIQVVGRASQSDYNLLKIGQEGGQNALDRTNPRGRLHRHVGSVALGIRGTRPYNRFLLPPRPICRKARAGLLFLGGPIACRAPCQARDRLFRRAEPFSLSASGPRCMPAGAPGRPLDVLRAA